MNGRQKGDGKGRERGRWEKGGGRRREVGCEAKERWEGEGERGRWEKKGEEEEREREV